MVGNAQFFDAGEIDGIQLVGLGSHPAGLHVILHRFGHSGQQELIAGPPGCGSISASSQREEPAHLASRRTRSAWKPISRAVITWSERRRTVRSPGLTTMS